MSSTPNIKIKYLSQEEAKLFEDRQTEYIKNLVLPARRATTLKNDNIIIYPHSEKHNKSYSLFHKINDEDTYTGILTKHAQKRLRKCVDLLLQLSPITTIYNPCTKKNVKHRLSFITLTISDRNSHSHSEVYETCLKPFLKTMREQWNVKFYIWKAELQERGQIHYHITTDAFINMDKIRSRWNNLQRKAGYIKHETPPSTEIKEVKHIKNLAGYLEKYISKMIINNDTTEESYIYCNEIQSEKLLPFTRFQYQLPLSTKPVCNDVMLGNLLSNYPLQWTEKILIDGKVWDASEALTSHKLYNTPLTDIELENIIRNADTLNLDIIEFSNEFCNIWSIKNIDIKQVLPKRIREEYKTYKSNIISSQAV